MANRTHDVDHDPSGGAEPAPGDIVGGKYVIEGVLGRGAAGVVVSARHPELRQRVAIKLLIRANGRDRSNLAERMMREARAISGLQSEHVVRFMDVGKDGGVPYLVMEHLDGSDLSEVLRARGPLPVVQAVDYVLQACDAIAEAHARGIVHRDLKPANLFLTTRVDGSPLVKVLDFGISKAVPTQGDDPDLSLTDTAAMLGSPTYMSPEQVRCAKRIDHRADIWAIGVILYKLLSGEAPFLGKTFSSLCASIIADLPEPMRARRDEISDELIEVILRCLEKDPDRRFQSVAELARALAPFGSDRARASVQRIVATLAPNESILPASSSATDTAFSGAATLGSESGRRRRLSPIVLGAAIALASAAVGTAKLVTNIRQTHASIAASAHVASPLPVATPRLPRADEPAGPAPDVLGMTAAPVLPPIATVPPTAVESERAHPTSKAPTPPVATGRAVTKRLAPGAPPPSKLGIAEGGPHGSALDDRK